MDGCTAMPESPEKVPPGVPRISGRGLVSAVQNKEAGEAKLAEAELKAEFSEELRNMSRSQGRLLIKLIDRETGHTGYELVRQLRGSFEAWVSRNAAAFK